MLMNPTQKGYHIDKGQTDSISCVFQRPDAIILHLPDTPLTHCQYMYFTNQIKTEGTEKLRNIILAFK
jgi:hypothetical protein